MRTNLLIVGLFVIASCDVLAWAVSSATAPSSTRPGAEPFIPDAFRPAKDQEQAKVLHDLMTRFVAEGLQYKMTSVFHPPQRGAGWFGGAGYYTYEFELPEDVRKTIDDVLLKDARSGKVGGAYHLQSLLRQYLQQHATSFYAAVVAVYYRYSTLDPATLKLLEGRDRDGWEEHWQKYASQFVRDHCSGYRNYRRMLFFDSLSKEGLSLFIPEAEKKTKDVILIDYVLFDYWSLDMALKQRSVAGSPDSPEIFAVKNAIDRFVDKKETKGLDELGSERGNMRAWTLFLLQTDPDDARLDSFTNAFVQYIHKRDRDLPALRSVAHALLVAQGYDYDSTQGQYKLNACGKPLVDYLVERSAPGAVDTLQIMHDHGERDIILAAIQKHHHLPSFKAYRERLRTGK